MENEEVEKIEEEVEETATRAPSDFTGVSSITMATTLAGTNCDASRSYAVTQEPPKEEEPVKRGWFGRRK